MEDKEKLISELSAAIHGKALKKITLSRPLNKDILRAECRLFLRKGLLYLQIETFTADGKALHRNIDCEKAPEEVACEFISGYRQMNILTSGGQREAKFSSKGKLLISGRTGNSSVLPPAEHDKVKRHILYDGTKYDFLISLGVTSADGTVFDRKRSKFRQIDRFLQYINDIYPELPADGTLHVLDLCCGKSYLTFAAYWFLTAVKNRTVSMLGADIKSDVIEYCSSVAAALNYTGLSFVCQDINSLHYNNKPDLVLSLHACDIATDIVLTSAVRLGARVILSTPCCQHEVMGQLDTSSHLGAELSPLLEHSLLKQKVCSALTDALRCKRLQAAGYSVTVTELIDPEDTPKNLLIRAVKINMSETDKQKYASEFTALQEIASVRIWGE